LVLVSLLLPPPMSALFPYTTLFRSTCSRTAHGSAGTVKVDRRALGSPDLYGPIVTACHSRSPVVAATASSRSQAANRCRGDNVEDRKSTRLNSSHVKISYAVFCLKK